MAERTSGRWFFGKLAALSFIAAITACASLLANPARIWADSPGVRQAMAPEEKPGVQPTPLPAPGKKISINENLYFIYEFSEKPKLGTVILKIHIYDKDGSQLTPFTIKGRSDMPSMRGAHDSGEQEFQVNKYGNYLLPIHIVMPGEWEVQLNFYEGEKLVFSGSFKFHV